MPAPRKEQLKTLLAASQTLQSGDSIIINAPLNQVMTLFDRYSISATAKIVIVIDDYGSDQPVISKPVRVTFL